MNPPPTDAADPLAPYKARHQAEMTALALRAPASRAAFARALELPTPHYEIAAIALLDQLHAKLAAFCEEVDQWPPEAAA